MARMMASGLFGKFSNLLPDTNPDAYPLASKLSSPAPFPLSSPAPFPSSSPTPSPLSLPALHPSAISLVIASAIALVIASAIALVIASARSLVIASGARQSRWRRRPGPCDGIAASLQSSPMTNSVPVRTPTPLTSSCQNIYTNHAKQKQLFSNQKAGVQIDGQPVSTKSQPVVGASRRAKT